MTLKTFRRSKVPFAASRALWGVLTRRRASAPPAREEMHLRTVAMNFKIAGYPPALPRAATNSSSISIPLFTRTYGFLGTASVLPIRTKIHHKHTLRSVGRTKLHWASVCIRINSE